MTTPHLSDESSTGPTRLERGLALLDTVGAGAPTPLETLDDIAPDLARYAVEFAYGDLYSRPHLTLRDRQFVTIAALAALGTAEPQLRFHIAGALNVGCTRREITEVLIHTLVYAGVPAALNAVTAARAVFDSHPGYLQESQASEATDSNSAEDSHSDIDDRYTRGLAALSAVDGHAGEAVVTSLADIAPDLGRYIIEFVFGDIYARHGIDLRTRELASVAMCTALGTAAPQLRVHLHGLLNTGGTRDDAVETITHLAAYAGFPAALNGITALRQVLQERETPANSGRG
ncbi:carboxymuconolactone decarboxylase family protein [Streptomyces sp. cg35]|uniref:carboxymuconolactone decarboxylase family protein n=1 Tax=Streptomyces sp. cg35 TaxID=3421650 RepID=UPI003D180CE3